MFKKVVFLLILGLISVGVVFAADNATVFNVPTGFEDVGDGVFVLYDSIKKPDQILSIISYTEHDESDYLTNDSENNYTVFALENGTFNFIDKSMGEKGSIEIIEVDGAKFIVDFAKEGIDDENDFDDTFKNLMEFNKLNNVTPINVTLPNQNNATD